MAKVFESLVSILSCFYASQESNNAAMCRFRGFCIGDVGPYDFGYCN